MAINKIIPRLISGTQIASAVKTVYAKVKENFYTRTQSDERYQKKDGSNGTAAGVSALMNKLTIGTSDPTDNDYYICQYAGNENITTYHRRKTSSLWNYLKNKMDALYLGKTGTAERAKSATYIKEDSPRKGSANINFSNDAGLHKFLADAGTTVGKPANDAHIIHCEWDNNQSWAAQVALPANSKAGQRMQYRYQRGQTWTDWESVATVSDLENIDADTLDGVHASGFVKANPLTPNCYAGTLEYLELSDDGYWVSQPEGTLILDGDASTLKGGDIVRFEIEGHGTFTVSMLTSRRFMLQVNPNVLYIVALSEYERWAGQTLFNAKVFAVALEEV